MGADDRRDEIERAAAEWIVRQGGASLGAGERAAFDAWYAADPAHAAAYERLRAAWAALDVLKDAPGPLRDVIPPPESPPREPPPPKPRRGGPKTGLALLLLSGGLAALYGAGDPWIAWTADYRTGPGETRGVHLPDGTDVELGAATAVALDFGPGARRVRLLTGEALFTVASIDAGERRPFVVAAGGGTATALGTRFLVEDRGGGATVTAIENRVAVTADGAPDAGRVVLSPGDAVSYEAAHLDAVARVDPADALAWRRGVLAFDRSRLRDVVARIGRYRRGRVVVIGAGLGGRRVSGVFRTDDLDQAVDALAAELGARVITLPLLTIIY